MSRLVAVCAAALLLAGPGWTDDKKDDKKLDTQVKVDAGKEITLTPADVKVSETPDDGRFQVTTKAKDPAKVKMPAQGFGLGFRGEPVKGGGVKVLSLAEMSSLRHMRAEAGSDVAGWEAEEGDVITHANGYAVNTIEELLCAISLSKDKSEVQIVVKDVGNTKPYVFYVTATKQ
jgi:hypothetical protein